MERGHKVFLLDGTKTTRVDGQGAYFLYTLSKQARHQEAIMATTHLPAERLDPGADNVLKQAGIRHFHSADDAIQDPTIQKILTESYVALEDAPHQFTKEFFEALPVIIAGAVDALEKHFGIRCDKKPTARFSLDECRASTLAAASLISFEGDLSGSLYCLLPKTSVALFSEETRKAKEVSDAVKELGNLILGRAKTLLYTRRIAIGLSLPVIIRSLAKERAAQTTTKGIRVTLTVGKHPLILYFTPAVFLTIL